MPGMIGRVLARLGWLAPWVAGCAAMAETNYVRAGNAGATAPYTNWSMAAAAIQEAVDAAAVGNLVLVSNGVYATGGRAVAGGLTNRVMLDKAVTLRSVNGAAATWIVGQAGAGGVPGTGAVRCLYLAHGAVVAGFTLSRGHTLRTGPYTNDSGGAAWCAGPDAVISNCVVVSNQCWAFGGGVYQGTVVDTVLAANRAANGWGGGAYAAVLRGCQVAANWSYAGGGVYESTLDDCTVSGNWSIDGGGAHDSLLRRCVVRGNTADNGGGGGKDCAFYNCLLADNAGPFGGGGAWASVLYNCTVAGNAATSTVGIGGYGGGVYEGQASNSVVYYNRAFVSDNWDAANLAFCCTQPLPAGSGHVTNSPGFVSRAGGNYRLLSNSPCINRGTNQAWMAGQADLDRTARIVAGIVDLGAYEYHGASNPWGIPDTWCVQNLGAVSNLTATSDVDGEGFVDRFEYFAATDPTNAASYLGMQPPPASGHPATGSGLVVQWQSVTGKTYSLARAASLGGWGPFSVLRTNLAGAMGATVYTDATATASGPWFYRVEVNP